MILTPAQMFEETLKGMIQEARQMVKREETESGDEVSGSLKN